MSGSRAWCQKERLAVQNLWMSRRRTMCWATFTCVGLYCVLDVQLSHFI